MNYRHAFHAGNFADVFKHVVLCALLGALSRKLLTGEKFFFQTLRASRGPGEVLLAPTVPGEIIIIELDGVNEYMVQKDGFLAGADTVTIESKMQSLSRGLLGGEGLFILKIGGTGTLVLTDGRDIPVPRNSVDVAFTADAFRGDSRSLRRFESKGWIERAPSPADAACRAASSASIFDKAESKVKVLSVFQTLCRQDDGVPFFNKSKTCIRPVLSPKRVFRP